MKKTALFAALFCCLVPAFSANNANSPKTDDEKVLEAIRKLSQDDNKTGGQTIGGLPPFRSGSSAAQVQLAQFSDKAEVATKKTSMIRTQIQADLELEKQLPRAIGFANVNGNITSVIDFNGKKFRLPEGSKIAGWEIKKITEAGVLISGKNKTYTSYYDVK